MSWLKIQENYKKAVAIQLASRYTKYNVVRKTAKILRRLKKALC